MKMLSTLLGITDDKQANSYVQVELKNPSWKGDVEVMSGARFSGEVVREGSRISDGLYDFEISVLSKTAEGNIVAESKTGALININKDLKQVHWSKLNLAELTERVTKSRFTDEQIADAMSKVRDTAEYKAIINTGAKLISSKVQLKRGVIRFEYDTSKAYVIYPHGKIRGEALNHPLGLQQTLYKVDVALTSDLLENYKLLLKRLREIIGRRETKQKNINARDDVLSVSAKTMKDFNFPSVYPASLELHRREELVSLEGGPKTVRGKFTIAYCPVLRSLEGGPTVVGDFEIESCPSLTSLKGAPVTAGYFQVQNGMMADLEGCPHVDGMWLQMRKLTSLKGMQQKIFKRGVSITCDHPMTLSLAGTGIQFLCECANLTIKAKRVSHALGLCLVKVKSAEYATLDFPGGEIIKPFLNTGREGLIECQHQLIEAGYEDEAKL